MIIPFKQYIVEAPDGKERNWNSYAQRNFNPHIGDNTDIKKNENGADMTMRKLTSAHKKTDEYSVHHIKNYLDEPKPLDDHLVASANSVRAPEYTFGGHDIRALDRASRQHRLKTDVTVHIGMDRNIFGQTRPAVQKPYLADISPNVSRTFSENSTGETVRHVARIDIPQGTRVGLIGRAKGTDGNPVFPEKRNKMLIPRGGTFIPNGGDVEKYRDNDGNAIHVHRYTYQQ